MSTTTQEDLTPGQSASKWWMGLCSDDRVRVHRMWEPCSAELNGKVVHSLCCCAADGPVRVGGSAWQR